MYRGILRDTTVRFNLAAGQHFTINDSQNKSVKRHGQDSAPTEVGQHIGRIPAKGLCHHQHRRGCISA